MAHAQTKPFAFPDLNAAPPTAAPRPASAPVLGPADLEAAHAAGVIEGRKLAMETIAADEAAALERIAEACASLKIQMSAVDDMRSDMSAQCAEFLQAFVTSLAAAHEADLSIELLDRLLLSSSDRGPATLYLSVASFRRLSARLSARLSETGLTDIVSLAPEKTLGPGECRLVWSDGQARATKAEISAAIARIFPATPIMTEKNK